MDQQPWLNSFDPFKTHPFTNNNALEKYPPPVKPSQYPKPLPASTTSQGSLVSNDNARMSRDASSVHRPLPIPHQGAPPPHIQAPQPKRSSTLNSSPTLSSCSYNSSSSSTPSSFSSSSPSSLSSASGIPPKPPIFFTFQQDRSSPELEEILLRKKLTQALGHIALGQEYHHK